MRLFPQTVLWLLVCLVAVSGCHSMNKQPLDPYAVSRIPAPATYSYSQTILGQQPGQPTYTPPGAATTFPPTTPAPNMNPVPPTTVPPASSPMISDQPASIYGSLGGGAALFPTAVTSTVAPSGQTTTQTMPITPSSETAARSTEVHAATIPIAASAAPVSLDTWAPSSTQVVTQVIE